MGDDGGVNTARVTQADVLASNGVVHVINTVLVPAALVQTVLSMMPTTQMMPATPTVEPLISSQRYTISPVAGVGVQTRQTTTRTPLLRTMDSQAAAAGADDKLAVSAASAVSGRWLARCL